MRIARFTASTPGAPGRPAVEGPRFGVVEGDGDERTVAAVDGHPFGPVALTGERWPIGAVRLLAPVLPSKVVAVGKNYADHALEMGGEAPEAPLLFLKPSTSVVGHGDPVVHPQSSARVDYEGELAVVIGRLCKQVPVERAHEVVLGYTCANDVTARDQQQADGQWARAKGHDTFCPLGPWIETELDPADLALTTTLNDTLVQSGRTAQMVHPVPELVAFVSEAMTLLPGDVILTGTPAGIGQMRPGDSVSVTVEGVGTLTNRLVAG